MLDWDCQYFEIQDVLEIIKKSSSFKKKNNNKKPVYSPVVVDLNIFFNKHNGTPSSLIIRISFSVDINILSNLFLLWYLELLW